eukprot:TRINITY_DN2383_c0_g3_i3.p1 TRINITY_DN2383_c0_g3~~TRINITY_DN2383_c0_g3_i3.p1  ORF type:complete len:430 (+),score=137.87 TRINITY_DN2383_c0_g3_i3:639-1928(+)
MVSDSDKLKEAGIHFLTAASIFERISLESKGLRREELSLDFSETNLRMCQCITRAQAQSCAFEKVKQSGFNKFNLLSQLAMQASSYYSQAYHLMTSSSMSRVVNLKKFSSIMYFNKCVFEAQANYWMSEKCVSNIKNLKSDAGKAIAYINRALSSLTSLEEQKANIAPGLYLQRENLFSRYSKRKEYLVQVNAEKYHEAVPKTVDDIDCFPFSQPLSLEEDLSCPFEGREVLERLVPLEVNELKGRYKVFVGSIIRIAEKVLAEANATQEAFLARHNLPACFYAAVEEEKVPEALLVKIQQCKEKGGMRLMKVALDGLNYAAASSESKINSMIAQLQYEVEEDEAFRQRYGKQCMLTRSEELVQPLRRQVQYYAQKLKEARKVEERVGEIFVVEEENMELIEIDKEELMAKIPRSENAGRESPIGLQYA